jgi:hypothetical protein
MYEVESFQCQVSVDRTRLQAGKHHGARILTSLFITYRHDPTSDALFPAVDYSYRTLVLMYVFTANKIDWHAPTCFMIDVSLQCSERRYLCGKQGSKVNIMIHDRFKLIEFVDLLLTPPKTWHLRGSQNLR